MRILQLGKFYPIKGGVEKVMHDLTVGLAERGLECDMLCAHEGKGTLTVKVSHRARVIAVRSLGKLFGTMLSPALVWAAMKMCRHYDIVHIHHPDPLACLALWFARYKGRVILHWHSDIIKQKRLLIAYRPLQRWLLRRAELVVCTTPTYLEQSPCLQAYRHKGVALPIGIDTVKPDADGVRAIQEQYAGRKIVFSLGRLVPYKGFSYLIEAAQQLGDDYVVLIGGKGPLHDELQSLITSLGLDHKVKLLGRISDDEASNYYGACTLFCLPSVQKTEAFGIVQIEAMSCGKPVVATTIEGSGVAWVNAHGVSGLNVPPRNAAALAEAIGEIASNDSVYKNFCSGARKRFVALFEKDMMIDKCISIYEKCNDEQFSRKHK